MEEQKEPDINTVVSESPKKSHRITKYMLVGIFILLPFIGIYIGMQYKNTKLSNSQHPIQKVNTSGVQDISTAKITPIPSKQVMEIDDTSRKAFIAYSDSPYEEFTVIIYDPGSNTIETKKTISHDAILGTVNYSLGANDAVQYNPDTKDIYFATHGLDILDGTCANSDGTCGVSIYRIGLNETEPTIIYRSDNYYLQNWILNKYDNSILLVQLAFNGESKTVNQTIEKIDATDGALIYANSHDEPGTDLSQSLVLSQDGSSISQAYEVEVGIVQRQLFLRTINVADGQINDMLVKQISDFISSDISISPSNKYVAYRIDDDLIISDIQTDKTIQTYKIGDWHSPRMVWADASTVLSYTDTDNSFILHDAEYNNEQELDITKAENQLHPLSEHNPSNNYLVLLDYISMFVYTISSGDLIAIPEVSILHPSNVYGIHWF